MGKLQMINQQQSLNYILSFAVRVLQIKHNTHEQGTVQFHPPINLMNME